MNREDNSDSLFPVQIKDAIWFAPVCRGIFSMPKPSIRYIVKKIIVASIPSYICWYAHAG